MDDESDESKQVFVKDILFATLDTSLRRARLPNGQIYLLTDTVGFVSKLPTHLIEAFKGTLEETKYADMLLHVVDASNSDIDIQIKTTIEILKELEVLDKPIITVFNKMDRTDIQSLIYESNLVGEKIFISAKNDVNIDKLKLLIQEKLPQEYKYILMKIPYDKQTILNYFMNNYEIENLRHEEDGTYFDLAINILDYERYKDYIVNPKTKIEK
jgi:GTP-binding protein HflX